MKFSASILALVAFTAVQAVAVAEAEPRGHLGFCGAPGASCARSADAEARGHLGFCGAPGASCAKSRRAAEAVADALANPRGRLGFCGAPGASCARDAEARGHLGFCGAPGASCAKAKRYVENIGDALDDMIKRDARGRLGFCGAPGASCARDAVASAEARGRLGFCGAWGASCARNAQPQPNAEARGHLGFCGAPGASCAKAKRAVEAINDVDPEYLKKQCFEEGGECNQILKARDALAAVKREASAAAEASPRGRLGFCGAPGASCARETHEYLKAAERGEESAKRAETDCYGPDGECTAADEDFAVLERSINEAVEALAEI